MRKYVLGFVFNPELTDVLLILKNRPEEQHHRLNGIGGKMEPTDSSIHHAMSREFSEETSAIIPPNSWKHFITMVNNNDKGRWKEKWEVECFASVLDTERFIKVHAEESEPLVKMSVNNLSPLCLPNIRWLIPMAINALVHNEKFHAVEWV